MPGLAVNWCHKVEVEPGISTGEMEAICQNWRVNQSCKPETEPGVKARSLKLEQSRDWNKDKYNCEDGAY